MRIEFDDGTLLLQDAPDNIPYGEWDDRVDEYRAQANRYRELLDWAGTWDDNSEQRTLAQGFDLTIEDAARAYPDIQLTPALHIEPRDYQQAALDAWTDHGRRAASSSRRAAGRRSSACKPSPTPVSVRSSSPRRSTC